MQHNLNNVSPIEKIISILSYMSMGMIGLIWIIIAYLMKRNLRYFLMYNIVQSMLISLICAILFYAIGLILRIIALIPFLEFITAIFNLFISVKIVSILGFSFTIFQLIITTLLLYIIVGVLLGRIFYVPVLTNLMNKAMRSYR